MHSNLTCRDHIPDYLMPLPAAGLGSVSTAIDTASTVVSGALNPIGLVMSGINPVLSLFGLNSSDPVKDQQRAARINDAYRAAMAGDATAVICLREMAQGVYRSTDNPQRTCAVGSQVAATYAKKMWLDYQARVAAGVVGGTLIGASNIPNVLVGAVQAVATNPVFLVLAAGGLYFLLRRKRR